LGLVTASFFGRLDGAFAAKDGPEFIEFSALRAFIADNDLDFGTTFIIDGSSHLSSLHSLGTSGFGSIELIDGETLVKDEDITRIQSRFSKIHLRDLEIGSSSLNVEKTRLVGSGFNMVEAGFDSSFEDSETSGEIREEQFALVSLSLSVLNGKSAKVVIDFDSLVGSGSVLILGGMISQPEVDII